MPSGKTGLGQSSLNVSASESAQNSTPKRFQLAAVAIARKGGLSRTLAAAGRPMGHGVFEVRTHLTHNRIARVLFYIDARNRMVLLHSFIKKAQKTPVEELALARRNKDKHERGTQ